MNKPRRQHWVPCFYLRYFATPETKETGEPQVWILSKHEGDPALTNIRKVANRRYLYSPLTKALDRSWETEEDLAEYESVMARVWPLLATDSVDLHGDQSIRKGLALFVSLLYLRHPQRLVQTERIHGQIVETFDSIPKDLDGRPLIEQVEHKGVLRQFDNSDWHQFKTSGPEVKKEMFVKGIKQNATYLAEMLMQKRWSVVFSERPVFITTDTPVAMIHPTRDVFGFGTPGTVVSFPLSPTRVLMMDDRHDQPKGRYYPLAETGPGPANMTAWRNCERFMITPRPPDEVCAEMLAWADGEEQSMLRRQEKAEQN